MKTTALLLAALAGCSSQPFQSADRMEDAASADAPGDTTDPPRESGVASADAPSSDSPATHDAPSSGVDASADAEHDSGDPDGGCAPADVAWPIQGCVVQSSPPSIGQMWLLQTEAQVPWCRAFNLAGSENCEACASAYNCACLAPYIAACQMSPNTCPFQKGTSGQGCVDTDAGPYFSQ